MNSDQVKGSVKDVAGKAQRKLGEAVGSTDQQVKGAITQAEGKADKAIGNAKEKFKDVNATTRKV